MEAPEILPMDCWQLIISHLSDRELEAVSLVCKDFLTISNLLKHTLPIKLPGVGMLSKHLSRFKHVKKITVNCQLDKVSLDQIACSDISLEALDILCGELLTELLKNIDSNSKMNNLKALNCQGRFNENDLVVIANSLPNLEQLKYYGLMQDYWTWIDGRFPTDYEVGYLASKLKFLKTIHLSGLHYVSDRSIVALSLNCALLKDVAVCGFDHSVTEYGIGLLLRNRPNLEALSIEHVKIDSSLRSPITIENSISYARSLTSLKFSGMVFNSNIFDTIAKAKLSLKKFEVGSGNATILGLLMVFSKYHLTECNIIGKYLADGNVELIYNKDAGKFTYIEFSQCSITRSILLLLSKCSSLVDVKLNMVRLNDLEFINHQWPPNHTIQNLFLIHSGITVESAKILGIVFPNIMSLDLSYCHGEILSTAVEAILEGLKFLKELIFERYPKKRFIENGSSRLSQLNLEHLTLSKSKIEDKGLSAIAKRCSKLVSLNLDSCSKITVDGVKQIVTNITTLECLYIRNTAVRRPLKWMLSTGNLASLKKIYVKLQLEYEELKDEFLRHGILLIRS